MVLQYSHSTAQSVGLIYILTDQLMTILGSFCFEGENSRNLGRGCVARQKKKDSRERRF